jgi:hypothetical protein
MELLSESDKQLLSSLLWDTDMDKIDLRKNKRAIIERILVYGRTEHVQWMLNKYEEKDLIDIIKKSKNLDKKTRNYGSSD